MNISRTHPLCRVIDESGIDRAALADGYENSFVARAHGREAKREEESRTAREATTRLNQQQERVEGDWNSTRRNLRCHRQTRSSAYPAAPCSMSAPASPAASCCRPG